METLRLERGEMASDLEAFFGSQLTSKQGRGPDQERLAKLGVFGVMHESVRRYWRQPQFFLAMLFTLGFPYLLLLTFYEIVDFKSTFPFLPILRTILPDEEAVVHSVAALTTNDNFDAKELGKRMSDHILDGDFQFLVRVWSSFLVLFGVAFAIDFPFLVFQSLWVAGTIHTGIMGPTRSEGSVTFLLKNLLRKSPGLWYRLIRTRLCRGFLEMASVSSLFIWITALSTILQLNFSFRFRWWHVLVVVVMLILGLCLLVLTIAIQLVAEVADGVTVSEVEGSPYGLKAFKKGRALLKGKLRVAIGLSIIWMLISYSIHSRFGLGVLLADNWKSDPKATVNTWDSLRITTITIYCVLSSMVHQVYYISLGVLCASLEAHQKMG